MQPLVKISVVTVCYNSEHTIRETIESVLKQNYPNFEHIIVDGGSKDCTMDIVREYPHLRSSSEKDMGLYDAMNKGIQRATGEVVVMLNSDDCFRDGVLNAVGEAFREHPEWDALFGDIVYVDGAGKEIFRRAEAIFDYNVLRFSGVCYVIHQTLFVRRGVHERLGLYRWREFKQCADFDFILTMGRARCRIGHLPMYIVDFRIHDHGMTSDLKMAEVRERERLQLMKAHSWPGGVAGNILQTLYRAKRQIQKLVLRGRCDLVPGNLYLRRHMRTNVLATPKEVRKGN